MGTLFLDGSKLLYHLGDVNRWRKGDLVFPLHVEVSPSGGCNQRCVLCCVEHLGHRARAISTESLVSLVDQMKDCGVKSVLLAGEGEPTLNAGIVPMIRRARDRGLDMALNTNGVLLNRAFAEEILAGLLWLRFSFQAGEETLYHKLHRCSSRDFSRATENVAAIVEIKRRLGLSVTLGIQQILLRENAHSIYKTAYLARELGVDYYVVKRFSKHPSNSYNVPDNAYQEALDELKRAESLQTDSFRVIVRWKNFTEDCKRLYDRCIGIGFIAHVLSDGGVYPCSQYFHQRDYCYGNIGSQPLADIFWSSQAQAVKRKITEETDVNRCMSYCRHHGTNQFLADLLTEPKHVNFI